VQSKKVLGSSAYHWQGRVVLIPGVYLDIDDDLLDIDDDYAKSLQEDPNPKAKMDLDRYNIEILQQRYGWLRNEIVMNIDHRYKLVQFLLVLIPITYTVIFLAELYFVSFLASIVVLIIATLFYFENRSIIDKSNYLIELEKFIDNEVKLPIPGWEIYARDPKMKNLRATKALNITFLLLFFFAYSLYNVIFCYYTFSNEFDAQSIYLHIFNSRLIILFIILEIPVLIFAKLSLTEVYDYFKT
jgi:hypothetical protein